MSCSSAHRQNGAVSNRVYTERRCFEGSPIGRETRKIEHPSKGTAFKIIYVVDAFNLDIIGLSDLVVLVEEIGRQGRAMRFAQVGIVNQFARRWINGLNAKVLSDLVAIFLLN